MKTSIFAPKPERGDRNHHISYKTAIYMYILSGRKCDAKGFDDDGLINDA